MEYNFSEAGISFLTSPRSEEDFVIRSFGAPFNASKIDQDFSEKYKIVLVKPEDGLMKITDEFEANFIGNPYVYAKNLGTNKIFGIFVNKNDVDAELLIEFYKLSTLHKDFFHNLCEDEKNSDK